MAGRPQVYTNKEIIAALTETKGLVFLAAKRLGCQPKTIYNRSKQSPAVAEAIKTQRGEIVDTAELKLFQAIMDGAGWAIAMTLKTLGKDRGYVERTETKDVTERDIDDAINRELARLASAGEGSSSESSPDATASAGSGDMDSAPGTTG